MPIPLSRWRATHLLGAWCAYWIGLAVVTLTPTIVAIVRATSGHGTSSVTASITDMVLRITVTEGGATAFTSSAHLLRIALWIAVPPLALFGVWLARRTKAHAQHQEWGQPAALRDAAPDFPVRQAQDPASPPNRSRGSLQ